MRVSVDGTTLGWTKGSRLSHEFPLTLAPGPHVVEVEVSQYSATSYVEDQDMFWLSGIFRDLAIVAMPAGGIVDLARRRRLRPRHGSRAARPDGGHVRHGVRRRWTGSRCPWAVADVGVVEPWTAETPRLYDLVVRTESETARLRVGFRRVEIADGLILLNGRRIRFRGVNRHDTDPDRGRTVTAEQIRADLVAMKRANLNAVRTSHYPPVPYLLDVADELGLYVLEENDIETHAFVLDQWRRNPSDDPAWREAYLDRTARMVLRDRHHPSVVMWSLGNEAGAGRNFEAAHDWLRSVDPTRPIHYERDPTYRSSDVLSVMYPDLDRLSRLATGAEGPVDKPILLCEYAHAMGAGPGGLSEYEALFDTYPRLQGGFVWEWRDHTLRQPSGRLGYGGDFHEPLHDGAFAADGLHHGDGSPKPGLADYAAVVAPVRLTVGETWDRVQVLNRYDHVSLSDVALHWQVDGPDGCLAHGEVPTPALPPGQRADVLLPAAAHRQPRRVLTVSALTVTSTPWAAAGHVVGVGQAAQGLDDGTVGASGSVLRRRRVLAARGPDTARGCGCRRTHACAVAGPDRQRPRPEHGGSGTGPGRGGVADLEPGPSLAADR